MKNYFLGLSLLLALGLAGCSDGNSIAPPDNRAHAADWYITHGAAVDLNACGSCHGIDMQGNSSVPGCFSSASDGRICHPHAVDGSYLNADTHGLDAKENLTSCQPCHADNSSTERGTNPRFNAGIYRLGGAGCEACHGARLAHPANWSSAGALAVTFHGGAGNIDVACALCHNLVAEDVGGNATSCLVCHTQVPY
jgi:hypothetical protein